MALFNSDSERQRKENLKRMEDERLRFAQEMDARGFRPERMFFCSREDGSFVALALHEGKLALIDAPKFGTDGKFTLDLLDAPQCDREDVFEKGTGLNGAFGFGTKGARGFNLFIRNSDGLFVKVPVVFGRNSWMEAPYKKNPLLRTRRRRGDANVMWDFTPIDSQSLKKIESMLQDYYLAGVSAASARPAEARPEPRPEPAASTADAFYEALEAAVREEELDRYTRVNFGAIYRADNCLSVVWHSPNDCELCYTIDRERTGYRDEHLTQQQAMEKCLAHMRGKKEAAERAPEI